MSITTQQIIAHFAPNGYDDGIKVFTKTGKEVGYITDLRMKMMKDASRKQKASAYSADYYKRAKEGFELVVDEVLKELESVFDGMPAKVFINETMPNVHFMGAKFYFILSPISQKVRVNIIHNDACRMKYVFPKHATLDIRRGGKDILVDGLDRAEGIALVKGFARNVAEFEFANQLGKK